MELNGRKSASSTTTDTLLAVAKNKIQQGKDFQTPPASSISGRSQNPKRKGNSTNSGGLEPPKKKMYFYARLSHIIWISLFAYLGVLVRVTTTYLSFMPRKTLLPKLGASFFLPNMVGSFLLGTLGPMKDLFKPWPAIHVGLATGFCGSCTTFATWQLVAAAQILNGKALDSIIQSLVTFCTSYMCLLAGKHMGVKIFDAEPPGNEIPMDAHKENGAVTSSVEGGMRARCASVHVPQYVPSTKSFLSLVSCFLLATISIWILIFSDPALYRTQWWVAVAFGPIGAVTRYLLSLKNPSYPNFPLFTFIANISGTVLNIFILMMDNYFEGYTKVISAEGAPLPPHVAKETYKFWVRFGVSTGLMGSLSTVSTWVNEIWTLAKAGKTWYAYRYALCSLVVAQLLCLLIGGIWITVGNELDL